MRANILVLYDAAETHVGTIDEHLRSFSRYSRHRIFYAPATRDAQAADLSRFDAVVVHYSVRVCVEGHLAAAYVEALARYEGPKLLFIQDEYDTTETARRAIESLGIGTVFTCVPMEQVSLVYPHERFGHVRFVPTLTGYVPVKLEEMPPRFGGKRPFVIGYRGRNLPYWYGDLGQEKVAIGRRMKEICLARGIPVDIEWDESRRIYGEAWYDFIRSCTATLGTESGSNVLDEYGEIRRAVEAELRRNPLVSYEEVRPKLIAPHEGRIRMNQVSPRLFEAIACGSALVLFEGEYSGVVRPHEHFIPLRKDFANVDDVLSKVTDAEYVEHITRRAYEHVIGSRRYSYRAFVESFDGALETSLSRVRSHEANFGAGVRTPGIAAEVWGLDSSFAPVAAGPLPKKQWRRLQRIQRGLLWSVGDAVRQMATLAVGAAWRRLPAGCREVIRLFSGGKIRSLLKGIR